MYIKESLLLDAEHEVVIKVILHSVISWIRDDRHIVSRLVQYHIQS